MSVCLGVLVAVTFTNGPMIRHTCDDQVPVNREGLLSVCGAQPPWKLVMIEDHMPH